MSAPRIDYWISVASPWTYLGSARFIALARRYRCEVTVRPVDLGQVFAETGGTPFPQRSLQRRAYRQVELTRWSRRLALPINLEPRFYPVDRAPASRLLLAARAKGFDVLDLSHGILRAIWVEEQDIADWRTLLAVAESCGLPASALVEAARQEQAAAAYAEETRAASAAGVFGAPSYVYQGEIFWGQDRLDFLEEALSGLALPHSRAGSPDAQG